MRTNIEIDDELMKRALKLSGMSTKKDVVQAALETLVRTHSRDGLLAMRGKVEFWPEVMADREKYDIED